MSTAGNRPWQTSNLDVAYPFAPAGSEALDGGVRSCIAEAVIFSAGGIPDSSPSGVLLLTYLDFTLPDTPTGIELIWEESSETFITSGDPGVAVRSTAWGDWLSVEWSQGTGDALKLVRLLFSVPRLQDLTFPLFILEPPAFVASCLTTGSAGVTSLAASNPPFAASAAMTGPLTLREGYNTSIEVADTSRPNRRSSSVTLHTDPGAGLGKVVVCPEEDAEGSRVLRRIGTAVADKNGNVQLESDTGCYRVTRDYAPDHSTVLAARLTLSNHCEACCSCDDYVREYNKLVRVSERLQALRDSLLAAVEVYEDLVSRVSASGTCEIPDCYLRTYAHPGWLISVQGVVVNLESCTRANVWGRFTFNSDSHVVMVPGSFQVSGQRPAGGESRNQMQPSVTAATRSLGEWTPLVVEQGGFTLPRGGVLVFEMFVRADKDCRQLDWPLLVAFQHGSSVSGDPGTGHAPPAKQVNWLESHDR